MAGSAGTFVTLAGEAVDTGMIVPTVEGLKEPAVKENEDADWGSAEDLGAEKEKPDADGKEPSEPNGKAGVELEEKADTEAGTEEAGAVGAVRGAVVDGIWKDGKTEGLGAAGAGVGAEESETKTKKGLVASLY